MASAASARLLELEEKFNQVKEESWAALKRGDMDKALDLRLDQQDLEDEILDIKEAISKAKEEAAAKARQSMLEGAGETSFEGLSKARQLILVQDQLEEVRRGSADFELICALRQQKLDIEAELEMERLKEAAARNCLEDAPRQLALEDEAQPAGDEPGELPAPGARRSEPRPDAPGTLESIASHRQVLAKELRLAIDRKDAKREAEIRWTMKTLRAECAGPGIAERESKRPGNPQRAAKGRGKRGGASAGEPSSQRTSSAPSKAPEPAGPMKVQSAAEWAARIQEQYQSRTRQQKQVPQLRQELELIDMGLLSYGPDDDCKEKVELETRKRELEAEIENLSGKTRPPASASTKQPDREEVESTQAASDSEFGGGSSAV